MVPISSDQQISLTFPAISNIFSVFYLANLTHTNIYLTSTVQLKNQKEK